jgi:hypothetical protein
MKTSKNALLDLIWPSQCLECAQNRLFPPLQLLLELIKAQRFNLHNRSILWCTKIKESRSTTCTTNSKLGGKTSIKVSLVYSLTIFVEYAKLKLEKEQREYAELTYHPKINRRERSVSPIFMNDTERNFLTKHVQRTQKGTQQRVEK